MRRDLFGVAVGVCLLTSVAHADTPHRQVPDYDGRPDAPADTVDALLWVPRVATSPLYLVAEYVLRQPIGLVDRWIEQNEVVQAVLRVIEFGPNRDILVVPTAFYEFGFLPSAGLYSSWRNFLAVGNRISAHAATWGPDWLSFTLADTARIDSHLSFFARGHYLERQDYLLGIELAPNRRLALARYAGERFSGELGYEVRSQRSSFSLSGAVSSQRFMDTTYDHDQMPSVVAHAANAGTALPVGFGEGYAVASLRLHAALDTRAASGVPSTGIRVAGRAELASTFAGLAGSRWLRLDGEVLLAWDVFGGRRALSVAADAAAILPIDASAVPFDQTIDVGGLGPLPAFRPGELRGLSTLVLTLAYEWPIWVFLTARLWVATGNGFGERFADFAVERLRLAFGLTFRTNDPGDHGFELGIAAATEPFALGGDVDTVRFFVGARNGL